MTLIKNAELWFVRCIPNRPNKKFNPENPTWEVQIRTYDSKQKKEWEAQGLNMRAVVPDDGGKPYWKTTLKKRTIKKDGENASPVEIKGGKPMVDIDPAIVGNTSVGDVQVYQYEYSKKDNSGKATANVLSGIKLTKLVKYRPKARDDDFEEEEMEVIEEDDDETVVITDDEDDDTPATKTPSVKKKDKFD